MDIPSGRPRPLLSIFTTSAQHLRKEGEEKGGEEWEKNERRKEEMKGGEMERKKEREKGKGEE